MMDTSILITKTQIPSQPPHSIHRPRLIDALERGVPQHKLILISAPAGYGKTTLLTQWARSSSLKIAWLSLSKEDNDLERFLRYLSAAWDTAQSDAHENPFGLLAGALSPDLQAVLTAFINTASEIHEQQVFVLDDCHLIDDLSITQSLKFLIDHLPSNIHFVIAGRSEPALPLARYRARQELMELHLEDLKFQPEETKAFLARYPKIDRTQDMVDDIQQEVEGWIAGIQLMALSLQKGELDENKQPFSGQHRFIVDYLREDVLVHLDADTRRFLLYTSILPHLCASLCNAVTERHDSQTILERLERDNLFLISLDERREWFRYHHLFVDFLRREVEQHYSDVLPLLHRRAARWYLAQELSEPAFRHAVDGHDVQLVLHIVDRYINYKLNGGEVRLVGQWLDAIPSEWYDEYPVFNLARAGFFAYTGDIQACIRCVDEVEQRLNSLSRPEVDWQKSRVVAIRCLMACMQNDLTRAEDLANRALEEIPVDDLGWRPGVYAALGDTYRKNGYWEKARTCYLNALSIAEVRQSRFMSVSVYGALADLSLRQGHLHDAENYWRKALAIIHAPESRGHIPLPLSSWVYIRLGELLYEWNELEEARVYVERGLERAELAHDVRTLIAGYLLAGRINLAEGQRDSAADYMEKVGILVENAHFPFWLSRFEQFQLQVWLAQNHLQTAVHWTQQTLRGELIEERAESEYTKLAMARVMIASGDLSSIQQALTFLEHLLETAESRMGIIIEALTLQALALWRRGDQTDALVSLESALRLAEPQKYTRLFIDLGFPMARLLQDAQSRDVMPEYVSVLLSAMTIAYKHSHDTTLPEPLTSREQEILEWIAAGLTNQEIADKLVISSETVKKHAGNIYGKLNVSNRTEAVTKARALNLFDSLT